LGTKTSLRYIQRFNSDPTENTVYVLPLQKPMCDCCKRKYRLFAVMEPTTILHGLMREFYFTVLFVRCMFIQLLPTSGSSAIHIPYSQAIFRSVFGACQHHQYKQHRPK